MFYTIQHKEIGEESYYLKEDQWDDYGYKTTYTLYKINKEGKQEMIGAVKIGKIGLRESGSHIVLPKQFDQLEDVYFSLGQNETYYKNIMELEEDRAQILKALNDVIYNDEIMQKVKIEPSYSSSLRRDVDNRIESRFKAIVHDNYNYNEFYFKYIFNIDGLNHANYSTKEIEYKTEHCSTPPTRIHALIGENGSGKTRLLKDICKEYCNYVINGESDKLIFHEESYNSSLTGITYMTFSPLDSLPLDNEMIGAIEEFEDKLLMNHVDINILTFNNSEQEKHVTSVSEYRKLLDNVFADKTSLKDFVLTMFHLLCVLEESGCTFNNTFNSTVFKKYYIDEMNLSEDSLYKELSYKNKTPNTEEYISDIDDYDDYTHKFNKHLQESFENMSSGQKAILLLIAQISYSIHDNYLVLLDEPENYMHPPLLSAAIQSLSSLLARHQSMAIIATHSPIVLQEIPKKCVAVYKNYEGLRRVQRPRIETYGENLGSIISDVYGYNTYKSGFYQTLRDLMEQNDYDIDKVIKKCDSQLGSEAVSMLNVIKCENWK